MQKPKGTLFNMAIALILLVIGTIIKTIIIMFKVVEETIVLIITALFAGIYAVLHSIFKVFVWVIGGDVGMWIEQEHKKLKKKLYEI